MPTSALATSPPRVEIHWDAAERVFVLRTALHITQSPEAVFEFFSDAFRLELITPEWLNFQILTRPPLDLRNGSQIDYRISWHRLPIHWRTEICCWDPPFRFMDRQVRGPYRLWEHLHTFEPVDSGTLVCDTVRYRVWGGRLLHWAFVRSDLQRIFEYRAERLRALFSEPDEFAVQRDESEASGIGVEDAGHSRSACQISRPRTV